MAALAPAAAADELKATHVTRWPWPTMGSPRRRLCGSWPPWSRLARPLPASASFRPASHITDPLPRPILRASGMDGAVLAEGAVCLLSGAGGSAKSTLATTLALDLAFGGQLIEHEGLAQGFSRLFDVRPGAVMVARLRGPRRRRGLAAA